MEVKLICSGGMSTSIIVDKVNLYAREHELDISIQAMGFREFIDGEHGADLILLAPQISFRKKELENTGFQVKLINGYDYAFGNIDAIFKLIEED